MGVVNVTPDSFSDGGLHPTAEAAVDLLKPIHVKHFRDSHKLKADRLQQMLDQRDRIVSACTFGSQVMREVAGSEFAVDVDLLFLAMGFVGPEREGLLSQLGVELTERGNVKADQMAYATSQKKVFAAGDMRRGQSLVVWAIREGRQCAHAIDKSLMGSTTLPR